MQIKKLQKLKDFVNKGKYDEDLARYILGVLNLMFQGMFENVTTRKQTANSI